MIREDLLDLCGDDQLLFADGLDDAIEGIVRGIGREDVVCYSYDKCIEIFIEQGMTEEEAIEHMGYNVMGSYKGEKTPVFLEKHNKSNNIIERLFE